MAQAKSLPARPNLEHLKKQAKERLVLLRRGDRAAKLAHAQLAVARDYGFTSWRKLHEHVQSTHGNDLSPIAELFSRFAEIECRGSSPLYEQLSLGIAGDAELLHIASHGRTPIPNLFFAAVHYLLLRNSSDPLGRFYPSIDSSAQEGDAFPTFKSFCLSRRKEIVSLMQTRLVQTNEVARSAYLLPAFGLAARMAGHKPLALVEIGASAGLNLCVDQYAFDYGANIGVFGNRNSSLRIAVEVRGPIAPPLAENPPEISQRIGIDLSPVSATDEDSILWLEALIWPEHHDRRAQLRTALSIADGMPKRLIRGDASEMLSDIIDAIPADQVPCIFQTHSLNQFTPDSRARLLSIIQKQGARRELFFISRDSRLTLDHYRGGAKEVLLLAECDAHGKWIEWKAQPSAPPDLEQIAQRAVARMERGWAESAAMIERWSDDPGAGPRWERMDLHSPTLREREADAAILKRRKLGMYRIISVWHAAKIASRTYMPGAVPPTRSLEYFRDGDATTPPTGGAWRRIALPAPTGPSLGKPGRWEDLVAAMRYLRDDAPDGVYRVISVRRMLFAKRVKEQLKIIKKHAGNSLPCLAPVDPSQTPKKEWSVESLPERRKSHNIVQWKPIMDAAFAGNVEKLQRLLEAGADPNAISTTPHRYRPLHRAIEHKKTALKHDGHEQVVRALLKCGADPKQRATFVRVTALQLAAIDEPRFVPLLIDRFRPLDLFHAIVLLDERRVSELLESDRALARSRDENGWSTLHYAAASAMYKLNDRAAKSQLNIVRELLAAGADPSATFAWPGKHQWPMPVMYYSAGLHNNPAVTKRLLEAGATPFDNESVYHAADEKHQECLDLFEKQCDPKKLAAECTRCLASQFHWGHTAGVKWLLEHGADPNAVHPLYGESALHTAIRGRFSEKIIDLLFAHGGDVRIKTAGGKTGLQLARKAGAKMLARVNAAANASLSS